MSAREASTHYSKRAVHGSYDLVTDNPGEVTCDDCLTYLWYLMDGLIREGQRGTFPLRWGSETLRVRLSGPLPDIISFRGVLYLRPREDLTATVWHPARVTEVTLDDVVRVLDYPELAAELPDEDPDEDAGSGSGADLDEED